MLPSPSLEQTAILDAIAQEFNICVDAVPGSGKTTLALLIAEANRGKRVLILTYNSRLKEETREKVKRYGLDNAEAHSFHAFLYRYYNPCRNDEDMKKIVESGSSPTRKFKFDIVVVDECQDLDALKHKMLIKNVFANNQAKNVLLVVVGDKCQCIYQFYGADERYLTYAPEAFDVSTRLWKKLPLHHSWRLSILVTNFINRVLLKGETRLKSCKHVALKVEYYTVDLTQCADSGRSEILDSVLADYADGDIMVLAATVQSNSPYHPVNHFSNDLTRRQRRVAISKDHEYSDEGSVDDKILICNFHKAKGLERKAVIVLGFDDSYFKFYDRKTSEDDRKNITNPLYVALTRASERLVLLQHYKNKALPFVDEVEMSKVTEYCKCVRKATFFDADCAKEEKDIRTISVRKVVKNICVISEMWEKTKGLLLASTSRVKRFDTTVSLPVLHSDEGVARVNGVAIPLNARVKVTRSSAFFEKYIVDENSFMDESVLRDCGKLLEEAVENAGFERPEHLLKVATVLCCLEDGTTYLYHQIKDFDWLSHKQVEDATQRYIECLNELAGSIEKLGWEELTECHLDDNHSLKGRMDNAIRLETVIEAKFSHNTSGPNESETADPEHLLQLALYMMCEEARGDYPRRGGFLIDVNKGAWSLSLTQGQLGELKNMVIDAIYYKPNEKTLAQLREEWKEVIGVKEVVGVSNMTSARNTVCPGYPLCLKNKAQVDHETRKMYERMPEAEKASVYHYFLKGKTEDPVTRLRLDQAEEQARLEEEYGRFEDLIMNRLILYEEKDMEKKAERIDRLKEGEHMMHENVTFQKPSICGGLGRYECPKCRGDLEVGRTTFCKELCGFEASGTLYKETPHYQFDKLREYVGFA